MVEVVEGDAAALGFDNGSLVIRAAPDVWGGEASLLGHVDELDWMCGEFDDLEEVWVGPAMERGGQGFAKRVAEEEEGRTKEPAAGEQHTGRLYGCGWQVPDWCPDGRSASCGKLRCDGLCLCLVRAAIQICANIESKTDHFVENVPCPH